MTKHRLLSTYASSTPLSVYTYKRPHNVPITIYVIVNVEHTDRIIEGLRFVFIELPKFKPKTIVEKSVFNDAQLYL